MAVNLLSLAKQLGGSLHSTPRKGRSSGRSSYQNQPSNMQRGSHIPGTGIKQGAGLAKHGRTFGGVKDTKIRKVKGEPSHVNTAEAKAIDTLGPLGEAWVQKIGGGTINPKTGLREYGLFSGFVDWVGDRTGLSGVTDVINDIGGAIGDTINTAWESTVGQGFKNLGEYTGIDIAFQDDMWQPATGHWGIFGSTKGARSRDAAKAEATARHAQFEDFRRKFENENIAGIFTETDADDTPGLPSSIQSRGNPGFEQFIKDFSGLGENSNDIQDYTDVYDTRKEDELAEDSTRALKKVGLAEQKAVDTSIGVQKDVGSQLSSGLFGMLTQSADTTSSQDFAGSGNFAEQFAKKQLLKDAEKKVNVGQTTQEMVQKELDIDREQVTADAMSGAKDYQDAYNQEFWNNMVSWDTAINA